jgi:hypothetical protein
MRDARAVAAIYTRDSGGIVVIKDKDAGPYETQVIRG